MKTIYAFLIIIYCCCGCGSRQSNNTRPALSVTIEPLRYLTEQIAGDYFEVTTLVPRGNSPETYEPTSRQLMELSRSRALFLTGHLGFERNWLKALQANAPETDFISLSKGIRYIRTATENHTATDGHSHADGIEPHIWTSPENLRIMAHNLCDALCRIDSAHQTAYRNNLQQLELRIKTVDDSIRTLLKDSRQREFLIYHPTLSYFARDYGLVQHAIETDGKEPSPARLQQLIALCRNKHIRTVFIQQEFDSRNAETIINETGLQPADINPLSYHWETEMIKVAQILSHE